MDLGKVLFLTYKVEEYTVTVVSCKYTINDSKKMSFKLMASKQILTFFNTKAYVAKFTRKYQQDVFIVIKFLNKFVAIVAKYFRNLSP